MDEPRARPTHVRHSFYVEKLVRVLFVFVVQILTYHCYCFDKKWGEGEGGRYGGFAWIFHVVCVSSEVRWPEVRALLPVIETALAPFGVRPHW
jgi:hypothetical protein